MKINSLMLIPLFSILSLWACSKSEGTAPVKESSYVSYASGVVKQSDGTPIQGVAVTDGANVYYTDAQGAYSFKLDSLSRFVYISIPAGYEFSRLGSNVDFFQKIRKSTSATDSVMVRNFILTPLTIDDNNHICVAFGDIHLKNSDTQMRFYERYLSAIQKGALSPAYPLIHIQNVGDILTDRIQYNSLWKDVEAALPMAVFNVIGNHDHNQNVANDDMMADDAFEDAFGPTYYSYNRGKVHYISLDDIWYEPSNADPVQKSYKCPNIRPRQLEWLRQDIQEVPTDHMLVVSFHCPFTYNSGAIRNGYNIKAAMDVLASRGHQVKLISGHSHVLYNNVNLSSVGYSKMAEFNIATSCGTWWEEVAYNNQPSISLSQDGTPGGFKVFKFQGTDVSWIYKSYYDTTALTNFTDQARVFNFQTEGTITLPNSGTQDKCIAMNVWDWDLSWKVEWNDNGTWKDMTRFTSGAYDPMAVAAFSNWSETIRPALTYHMFYCVPSTHRTSFRYRLTNGLNQVEDKTVTFAN